MKPQAETLPPSKEDESPACAQARAAVVSQLFQEHNAALIGFLLPRVGSEEEARDIAQEAYVRMLALDKPGAVGFLRAYLFKTAANVATDRARQRLAHARIQERWTEPFNRMWGPPSPERTVAARQELELVQRLIEDLPPRCREAFYLYRFCDQTAEEIALRLGVTKRMVRKYLFRAFEYCRQRMHEERGFEDSPTEGSP